MKILKLKPSIIGLLQAIGVCVYCLLIALLLQGLNSANATPPRLLGGALLLILLVISAAICGALVFGIPAILALDKEIKKALFVLGYTFLYLILIFIIILTIILI